MDRAAAVALRTARHTRYPVYEHDPDHIIGMVHVKDLLRRWTDAEGRVQAASTARLDEVGERFKLALARPDVDTVSGLVLALLDRPALGR